jgi:EAL domain-containing protein (putative c-di-GMP-specific phosphodiesterase class I)
MSMRLPTMSLSTLHEAMSTSGTPLSPEQQQAARALYEALHHERFSFEGEPCHAARPRDRFNDTIPLLPSEHLLRPTSDEGYVMPVYPGLAALKSIGLSAALDLFLIPRAIAHAERVGAMPMSVNVSPESMASGAFRSSLASYLQGVSATLSNPRDVVLEVGITAATGDEVATWLGTLHRMGYAIAFDNLSHAGANYAAIQAVQPDYLKIDGRSVQAAVEGKADLLPFVNRLRQLAPKAQIIAEWVDSPATAKWLHKTYRIDAVQGRHLPKDRTLFDSELTYLYKADLPPRITGRTWSPK